MKPFFLHNSLSFARFVFLSDSLIFAFIHSLELKLKNRNINYLSLLPLWVFENTVFKN